MVDTLDKNMEFVLDQKIARTISNLKKNNMEAYYAEDEKELLKMIAPMLKTGETISSGGSVTLQETGILGFLRNGNYNFLDRYKEGLSPFDIEEIFRKSFFADTYFVSSNAVTEDGELYNVDGTGNRTAAILFGPKQVIVVVGINKIVRDLDAAQKRLHEIAAPANCIRLNRSTPCTKTGFCMNCESKERICNEYVVIRRQNKPGRIKVIIVGKDLGY